MLEVIYFTVSSMTYLVVYMVLLYGILRVIYAIIEDELYIEEDHIV